MPQNNLRCMTKKLMWTELLGWLRRALLALRICCALGLHCAAREERKGRPGNEYPTGNNFNE
jgi:hypothetical protein